VSQLWLFWVAPLIGAALAGLGYRAIAGEVDTTVSARTPGGRHRSQ
jgi:hypothetical protein